ncbi:MAG TPA: electron transfer flavoprotein subunit alpha/FixB family protein [Candidatus Desulfaltia sp.]|nr:electron transfer flavoprotein subunit alpha/FixB family protein [Candidatus Desulfaltia sp.]
MRFLVYSEDPEVGAQLTGRARALADQTGGEVIALTTGDPALCFKYGADRVVKVDGLGEFAVEPYKTAAVQAVEAVNPDVVLIGATRRGKELAPRLAAALRVGSMTECTSVDVVDGRVVVERLTYGGSTVARETCTSSPTVISVPPRTYEKPEESDRAGEVMELKVTDPEPRVKVLERRSKPKASADLESASIIVSAGRGFKAKEDLRLLEELAEALGAQMGCTRPISADLGWMDQWVGISGKKVRPSLYVACGISGTIQHVAGIRDSQIIVSVNSDESAGIHGISDYSIVGDVYVVLPALVKALRGRA